VRTAGGSPFSLPHSPVSPSSLPLQRPAVANGLGGQAGRANGLGHGGTLLRRRPPARPAMHAERRHHAEPVSPSQAAPPPWSSSAAPGQLEVELGPSPASPLSGGPHLPCFRLRAGPLLRTLVEPGAGRSACPGCALHLANTGSVRDVP
jgi:hypothetical protein